MDRLWDTLQPQLALLGPSGGLTVSGGEPLLQAQALVPLLRRAREHGFHTAVETSGRVPRGRLRSVLPFVSTWLFGLRAVVPLGGGRAVIADEVRATFRHLASRVRDHVIIRLPLIPGRTDTADALAEVVAEALANRIANVELLPLHPGWRLFRDASGCSSDPLLPDTYPPEALAKVSARLVAEGLTVHIP